MKERGLPVVLFDRFAISNGLVPNFWHPKITYMKHSGEKVGAIAADVLFKVIKQERVPHLNWVDTHLIVQTST